MDVEWIVPYREAFPWSARAGHALAALVGGALYTRLVVSQRRLPHQRRTAGGSALLSETATLAIDLLLLLPVLVVNTVLPFCFDSNGDELLSRLALAFMATWLGSFKAIGAALGRGPLAQAPWTPAQYTLLYAAPVYPSAGCTGGTVPAPKASSASVPASSASPPTKRSPAKKAAAAAPQPQRLQGRLADDAGSLTELLLALVGNATVLCLCAFALVRYDIPPWPRSYVYALGLYGFVCVLMGVPAAMIRGALGVTLVPPFDKPWLCHSVADYWGRRWNNTTSLHLRSLVYDIVVDGRWVRVGGHAMAAVAGGGAVEAAANGGAIANGGNGATGIATNAAADAATNTTAGPGPIVMTARRLGSAGGLLGSYLSSANLAELAPGLGAAGSRPGSPAGGGGGGGADGANRGANAALAAANAPPSTPAGNTRSRARAAATATVTLASFDLEKKYPSLRERAAARQLQPPQPLALRGDGGAGDNDSSFANGGGGSVSLSASPSPVRNGGGGPASPLVALAPAPPPTQLRRDVGVFVAFFVSAVFHEIILSLVVPDAALGWWFGFFVLQAPLMVAERTVLRWLRSKGVELPMLARRAFTTALLLAVSRVFFFTPIEDKSDLAQRVAEAVADNFAALGKGLAGLQRVVDAAAVRVF